MKNCKKWVAMPLMLALTALLSGCTLQISLGTDSYLSGDSYPDAGRYQTGDFTYRAADVTAVEIYWRCGEVEIVESDSAELDVRESGTALPEDTTMHYLLEDGTLKIQFCASGAKIGVNSRDKHLTVQVPKGINLSVYSSSATVKADTLEQNSILISALSGTTDLGSVKAESVSLGSSSGTIRVDTLCARTLECSASSGSVRVGALQADTADVQTSSGSVTLNLTAASQVMVHTSSGKTSLTLPEGGAEIAYTAGSGRLRTSASYSRKGDLYVFGRGESQITVSSSSGNLEIQG